MHAFSDIQLHPLTEHMAPDLAQIANDREVWIQLRDRFPHPYHQQDAEAFISMVAHQNPLLIRGIFFQQQLCGVISITPMQDVHRISAEIGYFLGKDFWGKGIATVAVRQMTAYAFQMLPIERIFAGIFSSNPASMRVLEKNGFTLEGVSKRAIVKADAILDEHLYALYRQN
jgi:[ribosomal protein S5]-alanine N-acetyltransferase